MKDSHELPEIPDTILPPLVYPRPDETVVDEIVSAPSETDFSIPEISFPIVHEYNRPAIEIPEIPPTILPPREWPNPLLRPLEEILLVPKNNNPVVAEILEQEESEQSWEDRHLPRIISVSSNESHEYSTPTVRMRCTPCDVAWSGKAESDCWVCEETGIGLRSLIRFRESEHLDLELDFDF